MRLMTAQGSTFLPPERYERPYKGKPFRWVFPYISLSLKRQWALPLDPIQIRYSQCNNNFTVRREDALRHVPAVFVSYILLSAECKHRQVLTAGNKANILNNFVCDLRTGSACLCPLTPFKSDTHNATITLLFGEKMPAACPRRFR